MRANQLKHISSPADEADANVMAESALRSGAPFVIFRLVDGQGTESLPARSWRLASQLVSYAAIKLRMRVPMNATGSLAVRMKRCGMRLQMRAPTKHIEHVIFGCEEVALDEAVLHTVD